MWFEDKVSTAFAARVKVMATRLDMVPDFAMAVMAFESNFNPSAKNPNSTATGLIQFMAATANALGVSTDALRKMDAVTQLDFVERYFSMQIASYGKLQTFENTYLAVFYPAAIKRPLDWVFPETVWKVNKIFDVDKGGSITKQEVSDFLYDWVRKRGYVVNKHITRTPATGIFVFIEAVEVALTALTVAWSKMVAAVKEKLE